LKKCDIEPKELEDLAADRSGWRLLCKDSVQQFEANRVQCLEVKRAQRKSRSTPNSTDFKCDICGRVCASRIGLYAHHPSHL